MVAKVSELIQSQLNNLAQQVAGLPSENQLPLRRVLSNLHQLSYLVNQQELFQETASTISDAAGSTTNLSELLGVSANIINNHFKFELVHIYLTTKFNQWAELRAAANGEFPAKRKIAVTDESLVGWAINQLQPRVNYQENGDQHMAFPLINRGQAIGAVYIKNAGLPPFDEQSIHLFQSNVANQLANTLQNAILFSSADQQLEQLITLHSINLQIGSAHNLDKLLTDVVELSAKLVGGNSCLIRFVDNNRQTVQVKAAYRPPRGLAVGTTESVNDSLSGRVIATRDAILAQDWPEHALSQEHKFWQPIEAVLAVPIHVQSKIIGSVEVFHFSNGQAFNENDLYTLSLLISQAGAAIEKTRLFTEAEHNRLFLKTVIEHIPDPIFIKDRSHTWIEMNQANATVVGYSEEELIGKTDSDFFEPDLADEFYRRDDMTFETNQIFEFEDKTLWGDNEEHIAYTRLIPIPDDSGVPEYLLGISHDVTERKTHEAERERFITQMSTLYSGTQKISTAFSERQIFDALIEQIRRNNPCEIAAYRLTTVHTEPVWAELRAVWHKNNTPTQQVGTAIFLPESPLQQILVANKPMFIEDIATDPELSGEQRDCFAPSGACSAALLPLGFLGQKIGVVMVFFTVPTTFSDTTKQFWLAMIDQAGMALSNRQLIQEAAYRAIQMETAAEVVRAASSLVDLNDLLNSAVALILDRFDLYFAGAFLVDHTGNWAELRAGTEPAGSKLLQEKFKIKIDNQSQIGQCIQHRQPSLALDVGAQAVSFNNRHLPGTRSEMTLPLVYHNRAIGALTLQSSDQAAFSREDIIYLQTMADQLANAIENARLFEQAQQEITDRQRAEEGLLVALERTESLYRIGTAMASATEDQLLYEAVLVEYLRLLSLPSACGSVLKFEHAKDYCRVQAVAIKSNPTPSKLSFSAKQDLVGQHLIETKTPLIIEDVHQNPLTKASPKFWQQEESVQSLLFIPMIIQDNVIGAISVGAEEAGYQFTQGDIEIGQVVADQLTIWLENRELLSDIRYRTDRLQTAAEVSRAASSILDVDELIDTSVNLIRDSFEFYYVGLFMVDQAREWAVLRAGTGKAGRIQLARKHRLKVGGESMIGWSVANRKARIALDVGEEAVHFRNPILPDTHSEMALPLVSRNDVIGAITVQSTERAAFSNEDVTMLQTMADQLANALANARLFENATQARKEAEERLRETRALQQVSQNLAGTLDVDDIMGIFFNACIIEIGFEYIVLSLVEKANNRISAAGGVGVSDAQLSQLTQPLSGNEILADIVRTGQTEIITGWDDRLDQALHDSEGHENWVRLFTPVILRHENVGVVETGYNHSVNVTITEAQIRFLKALISQTVLALDNARRYQLSQQTARREALIKEITTKVRSSTELDTILQTTVKEVGDAISSKRAYIHLAAPPKQNGHGRKGGKTNG
jgi:PAS domain S-box-containing protein